ncbi:alpha/beta hydrolase [Arachidicoccus soli]|uniref:Alpha/beta hydrolase n=1 Tax=Arachidicoccus soli TaxID=2341117 RepID=A0A386HQW4_9BACT|nr:alpha/beta hydrolase [Arachidicoccus soli]AYD48337.1 alpha/beta hydrolase [Arachidicoccus soli]
MKQQIQFYSDGMCLAGELYTPPDFDPGKKYPAILVGGSWTTVKEQMSGLYASLLAQQGFITLAIDPRNFGGSEGVPRFWENPTFKIADYKNAITYLQQVPGTHADNIFLAAICASAGYLATLAGQDQRVKGLATVAAWLHDREAVNLIYGGIELVQSKIMKAREAKQKFAETGIVEYVPAVSITDPAAAMFGNFSYYLDPERGGIPQWSADKFAVASWEDWLTFDPMPAAKTLNIPMLMVHSDNAALPDNAKRFFDDIPHSDKLLHWAEGEQFDFYDQPKQVSDAVAAMNVFFKGNLN